MISGELEAIDMGLYIASIIHYYGAIILIWKFLAGLFAWQVVVVLGIIYLFHGLTAGCESSKTPNTSVHNHLET